MCRRPEACSYHERVAHSLVARPFSQVTPAQLQSDVCPSIFQSSVLPVAQKTLTSPMQSCLLSAGAHSPFAVAFTAKAAVRGNATATREKTHICTWHAMSARWHKGSHSMQQHMQWVAPEWT